MSDYNDQIPFGAAEFFQNPERRCPCLLLLDTSGSMAGAPIRELNEGLITFKNELMADEMAVKRVEIAIVSFGPVKVETEFQTPDLYTPNSLSAGGDTPMGKAIETAIDLVSRRKALYKENVIKYYRPWIFLITDGGPTDSWANAAALIRDGEESKAFMFYAVGVQNADMATLRRIATREPLTLKGLNFRELFSWLSGSLARTSQSNPGDVVPLINPAAPSGWAVAG